MGTTVKHGQTDRDIVKERESGRGTETDALQHVLKRFDF